MNVLVLGATSNIGQALAVKFCPQNSIIIVGRDSKRLDDLQVKCLSNAALDVIPINIDLQIDSKVLLDRLNDFKIDLVINALSATSRLRDFQMHLNSTTLNDYWNVDVLIPIQIIEVCKEKSENLSVIFISSVLSLIEVPDRKIYKTFKNIYEVYLNSIGNGSVKHLIVHIGKVFDYDLDSTSEKLITFARFVEESYENNKASIIYGIEGKILNCSYKISPFLLKILHKLQRKLRKH